MQSRNKLALLGTGLVLSTALFSGCFGQPNTANVDHAKVMEEARTKFLTELASEVDKQANGDTTLSLKGSLASPMANVTLDLSSTIMTLMSDKANDMGMTAKLMLKGNVAGFGSGEANLGLELRQLAQMLYLKLDTLTASSDSAELKPMIDAYLPAISAYQGKWYSLDLSSAGATPSSQDSTKLIKEILETAKQYEMFQRVEVLPMEGSLYVYKVKPNAPEIVKLLKAVALKTGATEADFTPEAEKELTTAIEALGNEQITHKLYIDSKDNTYKKFVSTGSLTADGAKLDITSDLSSKVAGKSEYNASIKITPPDASAGATVSLTGLASATEMNLSLKADVPSQSTTLDLSASGTFKAGTPTITAPTGAEDLAALLAGMGLGAAVPDTTAPALDMTGEDAGTMNEMPTGGSLDAMPQE